MHSLIKNFSDWQRVYEATAQTNETTPIALPSLTNEEFVKSVGSVASSAMQTLCKTLLAKSACLTHKTTQGKDTLTLLSTSWFVNVPEGSTETADSLGAVANPIEMVASRLATALKNKKIPVAEKIGDLTSAQQEFDKLVNSSGMEGLGDSDRALEHPFLPRDNQAQQSNYAKMKNKEYDGLEGNSQGQGTLKVSISVDAANSLRNILTSIVNAILPTAAPAAYAKTDAAKAAFLSFINELKTKLVSSRVGDIFRIIQKNRSAAEISQDFSKPEPTYQVQKNQVKVSQPAQATPSTAQAQPAK